MRDPAEAKFLAMHDVDEANHEKIATPTFAVVIARSPAGVVLVFNRYRRIWELPGGLIDAGETARMAAARELEEEAGCSATDLVWLGLVSVNDHFTRYGAVYRGGLEAVPAGVESDEIGGITHWQSGSTLQPLGETDRALLLRFG